MSLLQHSQIKVEHYNNFGMQLFLIKYSGNIYWHRDSVKTLEIQKVYGWTATKQMGQLYGVKKGKRLWAIIKG